MHELVVISGKGGTGKTSLVASFAVLARDTVLADCDVDAADLHLLLQPQIRTRTRFTSGRLAVIWQNRCVKCGGCLTYCEYDAVRMNGKGAGEATFTIDPIACEGCGVCVEFCPMKAIDFPERECGEWYVSDTRCGPLVHAQLKIAAENSGKLVTTVRTEARKLAAERGLGRLLVDGPPGIGCPVIASITGASHLLVVTEPTVSGAHDLERVLNLAQMFRVPAAVCLNKWDINGEQAAAIEAAAAARGVPCLGRIPYDPAIVAALRQGRTIVETASQSSAAAAIRQLWDQLCAI